MHNLAMSLFTWLSPQLDFQKRFERRTLTAIKLRADSSGDNFMAVNDIWMDLGAPMEFADTLTPLHKRGLIIWHQDTKSLTLTERGRALLEQTSRA